ncbi:MAG: CvpA family protein, partial [Lachnospiraceae bacterium]|nr:CvpA family protein [Lachnospiraceae bacterium]
MKHWKRTGAIFLGLLFLIGIYYYVSLPAINVHAKGFWTFILSLLAVLLVIVAVRAMSGRNPRGNIAEDLRHVKDITGKKSVKCMLILFCAVFLFYIGGSILSSPIVNAKRYQKLLQPETGDFTEDVEQVNYNQIPLLDKDSAELLGNRKMGSMVDMVSQFEVSSIYSQINVKGRPVRVTPLVYASPIKWLTNQKQG